MKKARWEVEGGEPGVAGAENKQDAAPGWSAEEQTWKGGKGGAAETPHPTHQGGAGRSAFPSRHPSPTRGAHRSPRLLAGKSLNWAHGQAGVKDLVRLCQKRASPPPPPPAWLAGCAQPQTPTTIHGLTRRLTLSTRTLSAREEPPLAGVARVRWGFRPSSENFVKDGNSQR